jgi:hypothetical protein
MGHASFLSTLTRLIFTGQKLNYVEQIKENKMSGAVAQKSERRMNAGFWLGNNNETASLEDLGTDGKTVFKQILNRLGGHGLD